MHINPHLAVDPSWVGWMFFLFLPAIVVTVISGVACLFLVFDVDQKDEDFNVNRARWNTFFGTVLGLLGAAALMTGAVTGLNTNNDRWYNALEQQAQQRYGIDLNRSQAQDLLNVNSTDYTEQGSTLVILGAKNGAANAETVTLFHIGDTWLLGTGDSYTSAQEIKPLAR